THGLCYYHLLKKITPFGQPSAKLFQKAAYAYQDAHFEKAMAMLKSLVKADGSGAYTKLVEVGVQKWARSI
ncbi:hypothetical protein, partial [Escherichia coli]|uniref:hypothetical protein n=1 Tax=Escherichia coli TaxID=562 RepID=UPI003079C30B